MVKNHLKTIASPKKWPVNRKNRVFMTRPDAGPHNMENSFSLNFALIEMLKTAKTKRESRYLLHNREIAVNGKRAKSLSLPVGLLDVITVRDIKKSFRIILDKKGRFTSIEIDEKEAGIKPCKITGKNLVKGKVQLNFSDGTNMLVDKDKYKVGDTIIIDTKKKSEISHIKLEKGRKILLVGGKHMGSLGTVEDVMGRKIIYRIGSDRMYETLKKFAFVIGDEKPAVNIEK